MTFKKGNVPWNKGIPRTRTERMNMIKNHWCRNPEKRKVATKKMRERHWSKDPVRQKRVRELSLPKQLGCPPNSGVFKKGNIPWNKNIPRTDEERAKMSNSVKLAWKNPEYIEKMKRIWRHKPTNPEKHTQEILSKHFPDEWKYVGDLSFMVDGKNPDFMNVNGQKKLIEVFGDYWHGRKVTGKSRKEHEEERIAHFAKFGFQTLVVWQYELKDDSGEQKIIEFCSEGVKGKHGKI